MAKTQNVYFPNRAAVADTWRSCHAHNLRSLHGRLQFTCDYIEGEHAPHYPVPALPIKVEYVFGFGLADGIFVREEDYIVAGHYRDGMEVSKYEPYYADLLQQED